MDQKKMLEERAKKLGVSLAPSEPPAPVGTRAPVPRWISNAMPAGADLLAELKAQLDPEVWQWVTGELKRGAGYVVDLSTGIAIGSPPVHVWERGRVEKSADGFTVMRVRRKPAP